MPECWPLESWLRQHTQKPRIREFTEAELPHKQYTGRHCGGGGNLSPAFSELWHALCLQKETVSWEIPTSSILWHTASKISRIQIVGPSPKPLFLSWPPPALKTRGFQIYQAATPTR